MVLVGALRHPRYLRGWAVAAAMLVSILADLSVSFGAPQWVVSAIYPVLQLGILILAVHPPWWRRTPWLVGGIAGLGVVAGTWRQPNAILHTLGAALVLSLLPHSPPKWRWPLVVYFVGGMVAWWGYVAAPGLWPYLAYQACRLVGLGGLTYGMVRDAR